MKKLALLAVFGLLTFGTFAQKLGHINSQELLSLMPERTKAETALQDYAKGLESQLMSMQTEFHDFLVYSRVMIRKPSRALHRGYS